MLPEFPDDFDNAYYDYNRGCKEENTDGTNDKERPSYPFLLPSFIYSLQNVDSNVSINFPTQ